LKEGIFPSFKNQNEIEIKNNDMEVNIMVIKRNKKLLGFMLALATLSPLSAQAAEFMDGFKTGYNKTQPAPAPSRSALTTSKNTSTAQIPSTTQNMAGGLLGWASTNPGLAMSIVSVGSVLVTYVFTRAYYKWTGRKTKRQLDELRRLLEDARAELASKQRRLREQEQSHNSTLTERQRQYDEYIGPLEAQIATLQQQLRESTQSKSKSWSFWKS